MGNGLFTGDLPDEQEIRLLENLEKCAFLKVAHHGSDYSTTESLLEIVDPEVALISCGSENRYGHPGEELLYRLEQIGCKIYRTDLLGALTIEWDGDILRVREK